MPQPDRLFREEAVRHHAGHPAEGDVLRLPPGWTRWTYWLLLALVLAGVAFLIFGRVRQYASGPALVRLQERADRTAPVTGVFEVVALFPGRFRPLLREGMELRADVVGFPRSATPLAIRTVGDRVLGPVEARRLLGPTLGDVGEPTGSVVLVHADLPLAGFTERGIEYAYHDGMAAVAETPLGSERLLYALFPGLESAFSD